MASLRRGTSGLRNGYSINAVIRTGDKMTKTLCSFYIYRWRVFTQEDPERLNLKYRCRKPKQKKTHWQFLGPRVSVLSSSIIRVQGHDYLPGLKGSSIYCCKFSSEPFRSRQIQPHQPAAKKCSSPVRLEDKEICSPSKVKLVTTGPPV